MLLQTNSYIVPRDKRADHARLMRRFRQALSRLGCDTFEVYEQVGANWSTGETNGRFVQIMRFRDRRHQLAVQNAERTDTVAQTLIREFCDMVNFPYQQQQGLFAVGFYNSVLPVAPVRVRTEDEGPKEKESRALPQRQSLSALAGMVGTTEEQLTRLTPPPPPTEAIEEPSETPSDDEAIAAPIMEADQEDTGVLAPLDLDGAPHAAEQEQEDEYEPDDEDASSRGYPRAADDSAERSGAPVKQAVSFTSMNEAAEVDAEREIDVHATPSSAEASNELDLEGGSNGEEIGQPIWDDSVFAQAINLDDEEDKSPSQPLLDLDEHAEPESTGTDSQPAHESEAGSHHSK